MSPPDPTIPRLTRDLISVVRTGVHGRFGIWRVTPPVRR